MEIFKRIKNNNFLLISIILVCVFGLSSCGGGGSSTVDQDSEMDVRDGTMIPDTGTGDGDTTDMTDTGTDTGVTQIAPGPGLSASTVETVYWNNANDVGMDELIANPQNVFAPITTSLDRITDNPKIVRSSDAAIKSIAGDGDGGMIVTFIVEGVELTKHYTKNRRVDYDWGYEFASIEEDGDPFYNLIWTENTDNENFYVFGAVSGHPSGDTQPRYYFIYGARTEDLPTGLANYHGRLNSQIWRSNNRDERTHLYGAASLNVDFDHGTVNGEIGNIWSRLQTAEDDVPLEDNKFVIEDGTIQNGQFVATMKGIDESSNSGSDQLSNEVISSIEGFNGNILGEFYGPQASAVGAVVNATRNNAVLIGYLTGESFSPTRTLEQQANSTPLDVSVIRNIEEGNNSISHANDSTRVESIRSDGQGGITLTYLVEGMQYSVQFEDEDYSKVFTNWFVKESNNREQFLTTFSDGFSLAPEFNYLNSYFFASGEIGSTTNINPTSLFVNGLQTDPDNLPSGEANYKGKLTFIDWENCSTCSVFYRDRDQFYGNLSLTANFDESDIGGAVDLFGDDGEMLNDALLINDGSIEGNKFKANLQATEIIPDITGSMSGAFYGPAAEEVGGVIEYSSPSDDEDPAAVGIGWFGASR